MSVVLRLTLRADDPETCRLIARLVRRAAGGARSRRRTAGRRGVVLVPTDGLGGLSGKWVGPAMTAAGGTVVAINDALAATPSLANSDPYATAGWWTSSPRTGPASRQASPRARRSRPAL